MKILITGGCGFVGSNLALRALQRQYELQIIDNLYRLGSGNNLEWLRTKGEFFFHQVDIRDGSQIESIVASFRPDAIFHMAGQVAMTTSIQNPMLDFQTNTIGTLNVLEAVRKHSQETLVVYSSTNKVYGDLEYIEYEETATRYRATKYPHGFDENLCLDFRSPYGCSKGAADQYMLDYHRIFGLNTVVFRHSSIYGGRQHANFDQGWVGWFCQKALETKCDPNTEFTISGTGKQVRDVLYANDLVNAYFSLLDKGDSLAGEVFNLGGGVSNSLSLLELFTLLEGKTGTELKFTRIPWRISDQKVFIADNTKAECLLGWHPETDKDAGLDSMLQWCEESKKVRPHGE